MPAFIPGEQWLQLSLFLLGVVLVVMSVLNTLCGGRPKGSGQVNHLIKKESAKVANLMDIEDLGDGKSAFCRCWKSKKFPYCDGAHKQHNESTGDNVGPLVIERKTAKK